MKAAGTAALCWVFSIVQRKDSFPVADRHVMFWLCGAGNPAANQKNRAAVHCGYYKAAAVTHGYGLKILKCPSFVTIQAVFKLIG